MTFKKYVVGVLLLLSFFLVLVVSFNRIVDPFWYYSDFTIAGFNDIKTEFHGHERQVKPSIVQREQPKVLIFGSSYSEIGFDPLHPALQKIGSTYNFGLAGAPWNIVSCYVEFSISHDKALRQIILGIHPEEMPSQDCSKQIDTMEHPDEVPFLMSMNALQASIKTVFQKDKSPSHTKEGKMFYFRGKRGTATRFSEDLPKCNLASRVNSSSDTGIDTHQVVDLGSLREILHTAVERGIAVKLVVYPRHALKIEREYQCGLSKKRWSILAQISSLAEHESKDLIEVWDFEGYHNIGTESITDAPAVWWQDPAHFNSEFGDIMLDEMFTRKTPQYGTRVMPSNVLAYKELKDNSRALYIKSHPEFLLQLQKLSPLQSN